MNALTPEQINTLMTQYREQSAQEVAQRLCAPRTTGASVVRVKELALEAGHSEETAQAVADALAHEHARWYANEGRAMGIGQAPRTKPGRGNSAGIRAPRARRYGRPAGEC